MGYELLEHTADLGVEVTAPTLPELYAEALRAMTDCITEVERVRPALERRVALEAADRELLLVEWLSEALFLFESERLLFARAEVELQPAGDDPVVLTARLAGERFQPERHPQKVAIKAVTYHGLEIGRDPGGKGWRARVIFDI